MRNQFIARRVVLAVASAILLPAAAGAQQSSATPAAPPGPEVGQPAPTFTLSGATRYGLLRDSLRLADFKGQTVVLAFFPKARTKG